VAKGIALKVFNDMRDRVHDLPTGQRGPGDPEVRFIFGGYQWRQKRFRIWQLHYDDAIDRFTFRPVTGWGGGNRARFVAIIGDAVDEAKQRLTDLLRERGSLPGVGFDMEPFEVLRDMIRQGSHPAIGGAPQVAKVYSYLQSQVFAVAWPDVDGTPHALGRPAMGFEQFDLPRIDPDAPYFLNRHAIARTARHVALPVDLDDTDDDWLPSNDSP
jgi:hypothetical protein